MNPDLWVMRAIRIGYMRENAARVDAWRNAGNLRNAYWAPIGGFGFVEEVEAAKNVDSTIG